MMIGFHLIFDKDIKISKENQEKIYRFSCPVITIFILSKWYFFLTDLVSSKKVSMSDYQINTQYILIGSLFILFGIMVYFWIRNWFVHNKESGILVANLNLFYLLFIVMVGISIHLLDQLSKSYLQDPIENGLMVLVLVELGLLLWKISQKTLSLRKMLAHSEGDKLGGKNEKPQPISTQTVNENSDYKPVVLQEIPPEISIQTKEVVSDGEPDGINVTPLDPLIPRPYRKERSNEKGMVVRAFLSSLRLLVGAAVSSHFGNGIVPDAQPLASPRTSHACAGADRHAGHAVGQWRRSNYPDVEFNQRSGYLGDRPFWRKNIFLSSSFCQRRGAGCGCQCGMQ